MLRLFYLNLHTNNMIEDKSVKNLFFNPLPYTVISIFCILFCLFKAIDKNS